MKLRLITFILPLVITLSSTSLAASHEKSPSFFAMAGDMVVARPLLLATTILGGALFVVSSPFSALGGNMDEAADKLVAAPAKATFRRCLGCSFSAKD